MTQVSGGWGRLVWMSTFDAENQVRYSKENRPFVSVSKNGELLPATKDVIAVIAKHGLVLATGHVSPDEGLMLLREGRRQGVQHMVVTHAMNAPVLMDRPANAGSGGARCVHRVRRRVDAPRRRSRDRGSFCRRDQEARIAVLRAVRRISGQKGNPLPADGFAAFIAALQARGFTDAELGRMTKQNPAALLGLQ